MKAEESFCNSTSEDQIEIAQRELSAFRTAVTELFGSEHATQSTEDWLHEVKRLDNGSRLASRDWRAVTVAASVRLANRLIVQANNQKSVAGTG